MGERRFIPFGEFLPDRRLLGNDGLFRAYNCLPISGAYLLGPKIGLFDLAEVSYGFGLHESIASGVRKLYGYYGSATKLYELLLTGTKTETNRTRASGGNYAFSSTPPLDSEMWWFNSYADNVIATNFEDEVQYQATRGTAFANMITSTFKPQARFAFSVRQNLFLAYCFLPATYDGLPAGTHPWLVTWSQNDNIRAFGSENVDPALIGAGYQTLGNDLGPITAAIGGEFGILFQANGITRIDGPPYEFRTIVEGDTTHYPYSVFKFSGDIYFWGNGGPSVLRGGEPPVERLGVNKLQRSLLDASPTLFGGEFSRADELPPRLVSGTADAVNEVLQWWYLTDSERDLGLDNATLGVTHDIQGNRFTVSTTPTYFDGINSHTETRFLFLKTSPAYPNTEWAPLSHRWGIYAHVDGSSTEIHSVADVQWTNSAVSQYLETRLQTGFGRLRDEGAAKIIAVRPVSTKDDSFLDGDYEDTLNVRIHTRNKPHEEAEVAGPFTKVGKDGWIGTDDAKMGTYHSVDFRIQPAGGSVKVHEIEGIEIEFVTGGGYGNA